MDCVQPVEDFLPRVLLRSKWAWQHAGKVPLYVASDGLRVWVIEFTTHQDSQALKVWNVQVWSFLL